jgi:ParB family transcriptional regulator, chromosome partitioning protein
VASAAKKRGLGSGLSAILPEAVAGEAGELHELPTELIKPNPNQPRTKIDADALAGLSTSIEANGVVQPLLVRPLADGSYELIAGERRWRAAQAAGLTKVPAIVRDQELAERLQVALIENMVREDLNPVDEARACAALVDELGLSREELARRVGRSRPAVSNLIRLLDLPDEALELLESGELSEGHGKALLAAEGNDVRRRLARDAFHGGWSVRETENRAKLAGQPKKEKRSRPGLTPEEAEALQDAADRLESAVGHEVKVRPRGSALPIWTRLSPSRTTSNAAAAERSARIPPLSFGLARAISSVG